MINIQIEKYCVQINIIEAPLLLHYLSLFYQNNNYLLNYYLHYDEENISNLNSVNNNYTNNYYSNKYSLSDKEQYVLFNKMEPRNSIFLAKMQSQVQKNYFYLYFLEYTKELDKERLKNPLKQEESLIYTERIIKNQ